MRGDHSEESDIDIILGLGATSRAWNGTGGAAPSRGSGTTAGCLTPEEFEERRKKLGDIVRRAVEEGISA